jgi:hypothetical protein
MLVREANTSPRGVMLMTVLSRQRGHSAISISSHAGDGTIEAT